MFAIYIPEDTLKKICIEEMGKEPTDQSIWFKIFCRQSEISVSSLNESNELDEEDPLFIFSQSYGVEIPYDTDYIQSIYHDHKQVLNNPCGVYILDISEEEALRIQQQYGVICISSKSLGDPILCNPTISKAPAKGEKGSGWKTVINEYSSFPSNSILIVDRYLVANDSYVDGIHDKTLGQNNIFDILNILLPKSFSDEYHISIVIEEDRIKNGLTFSRLATNLNHLKSSTNRNYPIKFDLIAIKDGAAHHDITHDRRVISNYFFISATHKLNAFDGKISLCDQEITVRALYSDGLTNKSDIPEKRHKRWTEQFKKYYAYLKSKETHTDCSISVNGNCHVDSTKLGNRLLD